MCTNRCLKPQKQQEKLIAIIKRCQNVRNKLVRKAEILIEDNSIWMNLKPKEIKKSTVLRKNKKTKLVFVYLQTMCQLNSLKPPVPTPSKSKKRMAAKLLKGRKRREFLVRRSRLKRKVKRIVKRSIVWRFIERLIEKLTLKAD